MVVPLYGSLAFWSSLLPLSLVLCRVLHCALPLWLLQCCVLAHWTSGNISKESNSLESFCVCQGQTTQAYIDRKVRCHQSSFWNCFPYARATKIVVSPSCKRAYWKKRRLSSRLSLAESIFSLRRLHNFANQLSHLLLNLEIL